LKILKDSGIYLIGEIFSKAIPFFLLPYLTRKLGPAGYGELANMQAYIVLAIVFVGLSQEGAVARFFYFYGKRSIGLIVSTGMIFSLLITAPFIVYGFLYDDLIVVFIALTALSQTLLAVQLTLRQCQKKARDYAVIQLLNGIVIALVTISLFELLTPTFEYYVLAIILANLTSFLIGLFLYKKNNSIKLSFSINKRKLGCLYLFSFGIPLILHHLSFFMKGQIDRIFIYEHFSAEELGVYAVGFQLASVFSVLLMAVNKAVVPFIYENLKTNKIQLTNIMSWFKLSLFMVLIPSIVAFIIPEYIYIYILGNEFAASKYFTVIFLLGLGLNIPYLILVNYLFYHGKNKLIAYSSLASSLIYIIFAYFFVFNSLNLVPFSLIISNAFLILLLYLVIRYSKFAKQ
jgi:O-antigen/teichoic acid export membrane protein